jgi:hypothetical protein
MDPVQKTWKCNQQESALSAFLEFPFADASILPHKRRISTSDLLAYKIWAKMTWHFFAVHLCFFISCESQMQNPVLQ